METKYTCPMHPEIISNTSGNCPKCGMKLVPQTNTKPIIHTSTDKGLGVITWRSYVPLIVIISLILISSLVVAFQAGTSFLQNAIIYFMTGFFLVFGAFKLMDLKGFAEGYSTYDLLAQKVFGYGYIYPFIELGFGLLMLSGFHSTWLLFTEMALMIFSGIGVAIKIVKKEEFMCACLGTFLKVPLTYVTLIEDFGMAILAGLSLYLSL